MPRLPDVNSLGNRPVPVSRRGFAQQDTTAVGEAVAGLGRSIGAAGEEVGKVIEKRQREDDEAAIFEARRKLNDWEREKVFDPENGAIARRGKDAFDLPKTLPDEFDKFSTEVAGGLTSPRQQQAFKAVVESRRAQLGSWADSHALKQRDAYHEGQYQADLKTFADRAVLYANEPDKVAAELAIQQTRTIGYLRGKGQSEELIAAAVKENASRVHVAVISAMMEAGQATQAQEYLMRNQGGMNADDAQRVKNGLREGVAREKAQTFADEVSDKPLGEALDAARKRFSGTDETAAVTEIKQRHAEREAVKSLAKKEVTDAAWKVITNGGSKKQIPIATWNALDGDEQRQINDYVEAKWRRAKADAEGKESTDLSAYYGLRTMAAEQPEVFAKLDLMKSEPYLKTGDLKQLMDMQANIAKGDLKEMEVQRTVKRATALVKQEILNAGIDMTPKEGTKQAKETAAFFGSLTQALDAATSAKGKPLTDDEARKISMGLLKENIEQGSGIFGFGQTKKRGYQIAPDEADKFISTPYDKIPKNIRDEIEADLPRETGIYGNASARQQRVERIYERALRAGAVN